LFEREINVVINNNNVISNVTPSSLVSNFLGEPAEFVSSSADGDSGFLQDTAHILQEDATSYRMGQ
jgi:hypothetical protein